MNAFEIVIILVGVIAIVVAATSYFQVIQRLGRQGQTWFDRAEDQDIAERPSEDDRDDPIPRRPLRGRPK